LWAKVGLGADKVGTLHALSGHRKGLIDPKIANQCSRTAHSVDPDQPFRPIVITNSGDPDHGVHLA